MVDFRNLRASRPKPPSIDPLEIFRRLPKPPGINDLYTSQAQVLEEWFKRRTERDLVIKLHTGGGKTLVGLLIGQSTLNELRQPIIYLCPNRQLVDQAIEKAGEYSIPAVKYERGAPLPDKFHSAQAILVCTYAAVFNGRSRFGLRGSVDIVIPGAIILDDAHVASDTVRDAFTLRVNRAKDEEAYRHLAGLFRNDFDEGGRLGTFDDIVAGRDSGVIEIPYWAWRTRLDQVREYLRARSEKHPFEWPLVRDALDYCHALISNKDFIVTPIFPLVDLFPTFVNARRRIYMSATIPDDSDIIRTFDANQESLAKPITTQSLAGVSERLIIAPELTRLPKDQIGEVLGHLAVEVAREYGGVVILVPSRKAAEAWKDVAKFADGSDEVATAVKALQSGTDRGPYVFANRYDGIDLPGDTCRLLIVDGLPYGSNEYDRFRAAAILGGDEFNAALGQRFEQGIGRGARGSGDHCVVAITGRDLISWIGRASSLRFLTSSTNAQLEIGSDVSRNIEDFAVCRDTVLQCLDRDRDWLEYHAERLDELTQGPRDASVQLGHAAAERNAFRLARQGHVDKAIFSLQKHWETASDLSPVTKGWLEQLAARMADQRGDADRARELQQRAYADNPNLLRPRVVAPYRPVSPPGPQAQAIVSRIDRFRSRRAYLAEFDEVVSHLVPEASTNQFEQALADLGAMLGFAVDRPDHRIRTGPDVLWLLDDGIGLVFEAKSQKKPDNPLTKTEHGQLLNAGAWFTQEYPTFAGVLISVHPNALTNPDVAPSGTLVLTLESLRQLVSDARSLLTDLCESIERPEALAARCEALLGTSPLRAEAKLSDYLEPFEVLPMKTADPSEKATASVPTDESSETSVGRPESPAVSD